MNPIAFLKIDESGVIKLPPVLYLEAFAMREEDTKETDPFKIAHVRAKIVGKLDIRAMARLERTSNKMKACVNAVPYTDEKGTIVRWENVKKMNIPHVKDIPWTVRWEGKMAYLEATTLLHRIEERGSTPEEISLSFERMKTFGSYLEKACSLKDPFALEMRKSWARKGVLFWNFRGSFKLPPMNPIAFLKIDESGVIKLPPILYLEE